MANFKSYYQLTKPGIVRGNVISSVGGFLFAARGDVDFITLLASVVGISLVISSACVFNNYIDRDIDKKMERTKKRALVIGTIPNRSANIFASFLGVLGILTLYLFTNTITVLLGLTGFLFYVVIYGYYKRRSVFSTEVGSISGAIPITAGYTAAHGSLDFVAILLFLSMVCWQMPHFYAIAIMRFNDYKNAKLPVMPMVKGIHKTKLRAMGYMAAFSASTVLIYLYSYASISYLIIVIGLSTYWIWTAAKYFNKDDRLWAKSVFKVSLLVMMVYSLTLAVDNLLP